MNYLYIGLLKSNELGLVEVSQEGTNYHRIEMGPGDWFFLDENKKDFITNAVKIEFPNATGLWGMLTHFGIFDSLNNGKLLVIGTINNRVYIDIGSETEFKTGKIKIPSNIFETLGVNKDGQYTSRS